MGSGNSKNNKNKNSTNDQKPRSMPYKRQFQSDHARAQQQNQYDDYRISTKNDQTTNEEKEPSNTNNNKLSSNSNVSGNPAANRSLSSIQQYKPPPSPVGSLPNNSPFSSDAQLTDKPETKSTDDVAADSANEDEDEMTDAEALRVKKNTERALSPGINLITELEDDENETNDANDNDEEHKATDKQSSVKVKPTELLSSSSGASAKSSDDHQRIHSIQLDKEKLAELQMKGLLWGYCELTRKQLDEDQAAFLTWTHPKDGLVHSWAIFDGHGGYETALYSAQHFLKYLQKWHLTKKNMEIKQWPKLMNEIFAKFDEHIGRLNIRGGSTVVVVLLIGSTLISANAGDARAIMCKKRKAVPLSFDHSPMADYDRLVRVAKQKENYKVINKFFRINQQNETYKDIQKLPPAQMRKAPFISREMDKSRLLGTIGVARGFGDFSLSVFGFKSIKLKPYLSARPFVSITELKKEEIGETDLMCVACDGVFDVMTNQEVIDTLVKELYFRDYEAKGDGNGNGNGNGDGDGDGNGGGGGRGRERRVHKSTFDVENENAKYFQEKLKEIDTKRIDKACEYLGRKAYAKGTMDDVSIFVVPLKQILDFVDLCSK